MPRSTGQARPAKSNGGAALTDDKAKKPAEAANVREAPAPKAPAGENPEDKSPDPVAKV